MPGRGGVAIAVALLLCLLALLPAAPALAAEPSEPRYGVAERRNLPIRLADGKVLRANVAVPADPETGRPVPGRFPVILTETAYGKDLAGVLGGVTKLLGSTYFTERGYVTVTVDVRGTGVSEGRWSFNDPQEARDSVEVIEWAAALPESNGRVGMIGASYLGITQLFAAAEIGPGSPLKAIFPMIASHSIFREAVLPGGLLDLEGVGMYLALTAALNVANPLLGSGGDLGIALRSLLDHAGGLADFHLLASLNAVLGAGKAEDGAFWQARGPERVLDRIVANGVPAFLVGGLDDLFQSGVFRNWVGLQNAWAGRPTTAPMAADQPVTGRYQALVGPWLHAGIGKGGPDLDELALRWFDHWLKGVDNGIADTDRPLWVIERDRSEHRFARWPLPDAPARVLRLTPDGRLTEGEAPAGESLLLFTGVSLPCNRSTEIWALGLGEVLFDQLGLEEPCRDSSLLPPLPPPLTQTFDSAPVERDTTIAGPITATLSLTSTTRDAAVIAKLFDVAPDGRAREISFGGLLASHRALDEERSWRTPEGEFIYPHHPITHAARRPLRPGEATRIDIEIPPTVHTLRRGHRLRLLLATGEFPARFPLPGDLVNLLGGIYTVHHGGAEPSRLVVPLPDG